MIVAAAALAGGLVGGIAAGLKAPGAVRFAMAFLVWLGLLVVCASTYAQSMDIVPLTLLLGGAVGLLPFAAGFFMGRRGVQAWRHRGAHPAGDR